MASFTLQINNYWEISMIHITSRIHGIDIAGVRHPMQIVHYNDDQFTDEQLAAFEDSEFLIVERDVVEVSDDVAADVTEAAEADLALDKKLIRVKKNGA